MIQELEDLKVQVAASVAGEAAAVAKVQGLASENANLKAQLATAQASVVSDADKADLVKAKSDLATSASALAAA